MPVAPLVSVVTASYNQGRFIEETIQSVLSQDYPNIEHIVVDGGSTDNTIDILKKYSGKIKWMSEPDRGQSDATNKGLRLAKGEIVAWLNSDDTYCPGAIKAAVQHFAENPDIQMVYGDGWEIDAGGKKIIKFPATQKFDLWTLIYWSDYILQPTVFVRRNALFEVGLLDESLNWCMDWELRMRFGKKNRIAYIPQFIANSRIYGSTKTATGGLKRLLEIARVMRRHGHKMLPAGLFNYVLSEVVNKIEKTFPRLFSKYLRSPLEKCQISFHNTACKDHILSDDGWISNRAHYSVPVLDEGKKLVLKGVAFGHESMLPLNIQVYVGRKQSFSAFIEKAGPFCLQWELTTPAKDLAHLVINSDKSFIPDEVLSNGDDRVLSFILSGLYIY